MRESAEKALAQVERESKETLDIAGLYGRTLQSLAQRIQSTAAAGPLADKVALRSAALRLNHAATEGVAALIAVLIQSARLDTLATIRSILEAPNPDQN